MDANRYFRIGGTNRPIDLQNPDQFRTPSTDNGYVPNVKWSFSQSQTRLFPGGWSREQVIEDLPQSHDIAGAQQHLSKGAIRELHWHRVVSDLFYTLLYPQYLPIFYTGRVGIRLQWIPPAHRC
jgi:hypothetical protein